MEDNHRFSVKIPPGKRNESDSRSADKEDEESIEKRRWKVKFEQIQTQLSRSEIQLYDYKAKLNDLVEENANLRANLEQQIRQLQAQLNCRENEYAALSEEYNELKLKVTDRQSSDHLNEHPTEHPNEHLNEHRNDHLNDHLNEQSNQKSNQELNPKLNDQSNAESIEDFNEKPSRTCGCGEQIERMAETNRQLTELNERLRAEIANLESELEESSDKYREDQTNEFKEIKFKLENSVKNCRLYQFKLTKLERAYHQVKVENNHLTNKLKKASELSNLRNRPATPQTEITKNELDKAKEVLLRMHISLQTLKGEKMRLEEQLNLTKSELLAMSLRQSQQSKAVAARALSPQSSIDKHLEETIRDLEERESDLQEQLKFSEQNADSLRRKLSTIEQENELLTKQIENLMGSTSSAGKSEESSAAAAAESSALKEAKQKEFGKRSETQRDSRESRRDSGGRESRRDSGGSIQSENAAESAGSSQMSSKVEKVLQKENLKSGSLFKRDYEEKIESLERQLQKIKSDLSDKQQENENLLNLIDLKNKDKLGRRIMRSSSLQD